jgi:hypothetical protein
MKGLESTWIPFLSWLLNICTCIIVCEYEIWTCILCSILLHFVYWTICTSNLDLLYNWKIEFVPNFMWCNCLLQRLGHQSMNMVLQIMTMELLKNVDWHWMQNLTLMTFLQAWCNLFLPHVHNKMCWLFQKSSSLLHVLFVMINHPQFQ